MGISKEGFLRPSNCKKNPIHNEKEVNSFSLSMFTACFTRIKKKGTTYKVLFYEQTDFNNSKICTLRLILQKIDVWVELFRIFKNKLSGMVRICKCYHLKIKITDEKLWGNNPYFSFVCRVVKHRCKETR